jgi:hypoxanthine-guanine phosphoribosyltransferase
MICSEDLCWTNFIALLAPLPQQDRFYPPEYEGHFSRILIKREEIVNRAEGLAKLIQNDYKGKRPVLLCVLKGANPVRVYAIRTVEFLHQS